MSSGNSPNYPDWREARRVNGGGFASGGNFRCGRGGAAGRIAVASFVILLGVLFLLQNLGLVHVDRVWRFWPLILVAVGFSHVASGYDLHRRLWGVVLTAIGAVFVANNLGYLPWNLWRLLWPLAVILAGVLILFRGRGRSGRWNGPGSALVDASATTRDRLHEWTLFGGVQRRVESQEFEGGEATAVFGGVELDLRAARMKGETITIEANAVFGGVEIRVPEDWEVILEGAGILGGYADNTSPPPRTENSKPARVVIRGAAVLGGVSVRN